MSKHIPNLLTISNLICGCIALYITFKGELVFTAYLIGLAAIFDFMDGAAARLVRGLRRVRGRPGELSPLRPHLRPHGRCDVRCVLSGGRFD